MDRLAAVCRRVHVAVVFALGLRLLWLYVLYARGDASVLHHHIESHAFLFVAAGVALRLYTSAPDERAAAALRPSLWLLAAFLGAAVVLYWRALGVGWLSDDFVLVERAASWNIGPVSTGLFRPAPLAMWAIALSLGAGPIGLHLINVVLHALAAYLTVWVARGWIRDARWSTAAGVVFLTSPVAVEAIVWCSGVFDAAATGLVLAAVLCARRLEGEGSRAATASFWIAAIAALLSKETAAVAPVLIFVDMFARRSASPRLLRQTAILLILAAVFSVVRLTYAFGVQAPPLSRYVVQRAVFSTFDTLAVPWHGQIITAHPALAIASVAATVALLLAGFTARRAAGLRTMMSMLAWTFAAIAPVLPVVFLAPDNQGTRYFYLPLVSWAGLVAAIGATSRLHSWFTWVPAAAVGATVALGAYGVPAHLVFWQHAADRRDVVEQAARDDGRMRACGTVALRGLPDSVEGAYVFRNGAPEAFRRDLGIRVDPNAGPLCTFEWHDASASFALVER